MRNKLIIIGYTGVAIAYLNVDRDEAIKRFCEKEGWDEEEFNDLLRKDIREFEFDDEFGCYAAWNNDLK